MDGNDLLLLVDELRLTGLTHDQACYLLQIFVQGYVDNYFKQKSNKKKS
ncbi:MAG: hypothetical protein GX914_06500 [Erysipelotrichia bacterium]|nr:hypothetical protein [Erysipelotrichia bacterium]